MLGRRVLSENRGPKYDIGSGLAGGQLVFGITDQVIREKTMRKVSFVICILMIRVGAQQTSWIPSKENTDLGGYVQEVPVISPNDTSTSYNNILQSRFNTKYYPTAFISTALEGRFLLYSGDFLDNPSFAALNAMVDRFAEDRNYLDLTKSWPAILYGEVDRVWFQASLDKLSIRVGRQRVNWGKNLVWNPNDWFNTYSPINFLYPEGPGVDALRLVWYTGVLSVAELALEAGASQRERTFAALYKFNKFSYDIQTQAGFFGNEAALGVSWAGAILDAGFRGELSYFHPFFENQELEVADTLGTFVFAFSGDYTFPSSLYLHGEALYNGFGSKDVTPVKRGPGGGFGGEELSAEELISAKNLTPARFSLFGEVSYQVAPLLITSLSTIFNPDDLSYYISPSIRYSLLTDIDLTLLAQVFGGDGGTEFGGYDPIIAGIFQWSF